MKKYEKYIGITVVALMAAIIYTYAIEKYYGLDWSLKAFIYNPKDKFMDFFNMTFYSEALLKGQSPYRLTNSYMPLSNWLLILFSFGRKMFRFGFYAVVVVAFCMSFLFLGFKKISKIDTTSAAYHTLMMILTSFPLMFLLDRGNFEGLTFIFLALFIYFYVKEKYMSSILMLALCTSFKPYSAVFIILLLSDRKYREAIMFIVETAFIYILGIALLPEGFIVNLIYLLKSVSKQNSFQSNMAINYNHAIYNPLHVLNIKYQFLNFDTLRLIYFIAAVLLFLGLSAYIIFIEKVLWRKVLLITIAMVSFPYVSYNYTLINMYIPLFMFMLKDMNEEYSRCENILVVLFALLLAPKQYFIRINMETSLAVALNPLLFIAIILVTLIYGMKESRKIKTDVVSK